ncbi:MAG TPA: ADP-ribosylglycohydrolase family protein, partial [Planctomycetaceae bacterium]|nr:ADP-ribosylglycohydrolase family protein [Planctomycetaceae bacterium]
RRAVMSVIECGGDADTTAAIVGGIVGTAVGERGIPPEWLQGLCDYPRTIDWMRRLAGQLAESIDAGSGGAPLRLNTVAVLLRNVFFVVVVLFHGFRRLLPPY